MTQIDNNDPETEYRDAVDRPIINWSSDGATVTLYDVDDASDAWISADPSDVEPLETTGIVADTSAIVDLAAMR